MEAVTEPFVGKKIGRYQVEALLGQGRGAAVYRAFDPVVNRQVAIKVLDPGAAKSREAVEAFLADSRALANLRHPHILPIFEVAEHGETAYLVRQLTDGGTLRSRLREAGTLPVGEAAAILRPVATALDYAHRQGILHRNLRPTNILLAADGHPFITDFALPGGEGQASAATTIVNLTAEPEYASPEQARGVAPDARSDIYILGVILYEALVGRPPYRAARPDESPRSVLIRHLQEEPPAPRRENPRLGQNVELVLLRGLAKEPGQRFPTAAALFYALGEADEQDRAGRRRQQEAAPRATGELLPPAAPAVAADLDTLLATLDEPAPAPPVAAPPPATPAASAPEPVVEPPPVAPTAPAPAPAAPRAAAPPTKVAPAAPDARSARRSPLPLIGGIGAVLAVLIVVAAIVLGRGQAQGQGQADATPVASDDPVATVPVAAAPPQPTATTVAVAPAASAAAVAPSAAAAPSAPAVPVAPTAPTATTAAAASQPAGPVRREAIVYAAQAAGGQGATIVASDPDGKNPRRLADLPGSAWGPKIATDGRSVAFSLGSGANADQTFVGGMTGRGQHDLYLANLDGSAPIRLTTTTAWNAGWSWSPDGRSLAFVSNRDGNWEVYTLTFPGQQVRRLTNNAAQDAWPSWTPDGKGLIFMSTRDGYPQLYRMDADGGAVTRLITSESADTMPVVSPDGRRIAYLAQTVGANDSDIFVANLDGSSATRLTTTGDNSQPAWSPDGSRLAFSSTRDGDANIYTIGADGSGLARVTSDPGNEVTPTWGILVLPPGSADPAPVAQVPLGLGAVALATARPARRRDD